MLLVAIIIVIAMLAFMMMFFKLKRKRIAEDLRGGIGPKA